MAIELRDNLLTLTTTDATNYLYIKQDKVEGEDFYVVVQVDIFSKLVAKTTSENISLNLNDSTLEVVGNGKYSIELPLDEDGNTIKFPNPISEFTLDGNTGTVHLSTIQVILNTNKAALATTLDVPCYTGYYMGDKVISTDTYKICGLDVKLFDSSVLISPEFMNLLDVMTNENIHAYVFGNTLVFDTPDCTVYGKELSGINDYAVDAINTLLEQDFQSMCKLSKQELLQLLDRLSLFVGKYDKNSIYMTFTNDGLSLSSKKSSGAELIKYVDSKNFKDYTCCIDIDMLTSQIKANAAEAIELWYGEDNAIKLVDGNITQIVALMEDDRITK